MKLGIIFGGRSGEHEVSLMSATSVINAIDKQKYEIVLIGVTKEGRWLLYDGGVEHIESGDWQAIAEKNLNENPEKYGITILGAGDNTLKSLVDFVFPVIHGPYCEDGTLQGLMEMIDIPYAGCGVLASSVAMDKLVAKEVFARAGLPICKHVGIFKEELDQDVEGVLDKVERALTYPVFVKPANMGSSVGVSKAVNRESLTKALDEAVKYDRRIIIEEGVDCREIETGVLGNYSPKVSVVGEIVAASDAFYDYTAKYVDDGKPKMMIPADISSEISERVRKMALAAYNAIDGAGFARVDFFLDRKTGNVYLNEINTIPGFTKFSMFPSLWQETGVPYKDIIERIIALGNERHIIKNSR